MAAYLSALLVCMKPLNLLLIFAMVALGIVFGAIPGLSATLGIALLLPITFGLSTETSFVMLLAIWIGGVSGTFISAVLIGIPGSSSPRLVREQGMQGKHLLVAADQVMVNLIHKNLHIVAEADVHQTAQFFLRPDTPHRIVRTAQ